MNFGIINNSRHHPRQRGSGSSVNALLADPRMREIAKQMGLRPQDFGDDAKALWSTLNELSTSDPKRYQSFINDQLQDGPPPSDSSLNEGVNDTAPRRFFSPDPGFVIKCLMYHTVKCQQKQTKLFLNICGHSLVDAPKNPNSGREVPEDTHAVPTTSNLQVPLVVGKLRELSDQNGTLCCVVDVVVNPWVLRRSQWDATFKREVMKLALQWVQEDARVRLVTPSGKFIKAHYKGGVIVGSDIITSKFRIQDAKQTKQRMESPADLLRQINCNEAEKDTEVQTLVTEPSKKTDGMQKSKVVLASAIEDAKPVPAPVVQGNSSLEKKVLIEELPSPPVKQTAHGTSTPTKATKHVQGTKKRNCAVKRGFLNSTTSQLYPKGSSEGRPSSAYVNLLSRSKVVDLSEMEQQRNAQRDELKETMAFLDPAKSDKATPKRASGSEEVDHGDHIFEQLCEQAESDFKPISQHNINSIDTLSNDQLFDGGFGELAKLLAP